MALINCKECGREVSDQQAQCIHCGYKHLVAARELVANATVPLPLPPLPAPKSGCFKYAIYGLIVFVLLGVLGTMLEEPKNKPVAPPVAAAQKPAQPENTCGCVVMHIGNTEGNAYYNVTNYDAKNADCAKYLRAWVENNTTATQGISRHFLDALPNFQPPANGGMYGSEKVMKRVILQVVTIGTKREFYFDAIGYGTYTEK